MIRIVQFEDGKFGVRRGLIQKEFLGLDQVGDPIWWHMNSHVQQYCKVATIQEAIKGRDTYLKAKTALKEPGPNKRHRVVRDSTG